MRNLLILLCLWVSVTLNAATYYVAPGGSDSNPGTLSQPFFTLNKAWTVVSAGDIIYMRGGTYRYNTTGTSLTGKSGTSSAYITIQNYPGEIPVINYDNETFTTQMHGIYISGVSYLHLKGIRITNINQPVGQTTAQYGILCDGSGAPHCTFEQMECDHIGGWGIVLGENNTNNLFLNCDLHHNSDRYTTNGDPWGWSDGFESGSLTSTNNTLDGCRFWSNSDDGIDLRGAAGIFLIKNCWSFWNGFRPGERSGDADLGTTEGGDGTGYKLGGTRGGATTSILRTVENCLSVSNRGSGFDPQPDDAGKILGVAMYNCTAYDNASGWGDGFSAGGYNNTTIMRNNIDYHNHGTSPDLNSTNLVHNHNSFDLSLTVTDADFVSVSSAGLDGPRQADGSLPNLSFLHLAAGSKLIDAGVDVGIPYTGKAPDLGAYEAGSGTAVTVIVPVFNSASVENATPSLLEMTYSSTLANIVPAASAFAVTVNSVARTVNVVSVSGTKVQLTLSSRIVIGDIVTISYTKPSDKPLQTTSGGIATSIINQQVINNCLNVVPTAVITSPVSNNSFTAPANITIVANASDPDGSISMVEFYNGSTKLGSITSAPYSYTWNSVAAGNYSLTVIATDNLNAKTTSSVVSISVNNTTSAPNKHPIVKISNPRKGINYDNLSAIELDAIASDPDGTITKVEFYNGNFKLVELTSAPYTYTWKNVAAGSYTITAIATDNLNDTTASEPVEFIVGSIIKPNANSDIIRLYPNPNNGHFSIEFTRALQSEKSEIIITDGAGKLVYNGPVLKEEVLKQFDLSSSRCGMYVVMIKNKEILVTKKFIIK